MDLKTWRCEHDSTVRRLGPPVGFWNMAVTFLVLHSWKFFKEDLYWTHPFAEIHLQIIKTQYKCKNIPCKDGVQGKERLHSLAYVMFSLWC